MESTNVTSFFLSSFFNIGQKIVNEMLQVRHKSNGLIGKIEDMNDKTVKSIVTDLVIAAGDTVRDQLSYSVTT